MEAGRGTAVGWSPRWEKQGDGGRNTVYIQCIRLWSKYNVYTIGLYHLNLLQIQCIYSVSGSVPNTINTYFPSRNLSFVFETAETGGAL